MMAAKTEPALVCPRCGMPVDPRKGGFHTIGEGVTYHRDCYRKAAMFGELNNGGRK